MEEVWHPFIVKLHIFCILFSPFALLSHYKPDKMQPVAIMPQTEWYVVVKFTLPNEWAHCFRVQPHSDFQAEHSQNITRVASSLISWSLCHCLKQWHERGLYHACFCQCSTALWVFCVCTGTSPTKLFQRAVNYVFRFITPWKPWFSIPVFCTH